MARLDRDLAKNAMAAAPTPSNVAVPGSGTNINGIRAKIGTGPLKDAVNFMGVTS